MNFKEARDKAMTAKFAETYGPSMGASIPEPTCSLCWGREPHQHTEGAHTFMVDPAPTFLSVSMVSAPKCEGCRVEMSRHDSTNWECREATCPEHGKPVSAHLSGIYPSEIISEPGR